MPGHILAPAVDPSVSTSAAFLATLDGIAGPALAAMYDPSEQLFVFTRKPDGAGLANHSHSVRYSAITLIGLASRQTNLPELGDDLQRTVRKQLEANLASAGLGAAALIGWALSLSGDDASGAWTRVRGLDPVKAVQPTIEVAWALAALTQTSAPTEDALRRELAERLMAAYVPAGQLFPHVLGGSGFRSHVGCFADQVYPIHALSEYSRVSGDQRALAIAASCAARICALQGNAGQWWWHYDIRDGSVVEAYPVYAIHQDAMAPMALKALARAGGPVLDAHIDRGLGWLAAAPELRGGTLVDGPRGMVWRKVARREPRKASRLLQALASRGRPGRRLPWLDTIFPATQIDFEDRPYHWGWFYYAWSDCSR